MPSHSPNDIVASVTASLKDYGESHSCIPAGALLTRVLHACSFPNAYRLTVHVHVMNPPAMSHLEKYGYPSAPADVVAFNASGAAMVSLGQEAFDAASPPPEGRWPGHLVVIAPNTNGERHTMFDLTVPQVSWPEAGIHLRPIVAEVSDAFVKGQAAPKLRSGNAFLVYRAYPENVTFNEGGDLMDNPSIEQVIAETIARLNG